MRSRHAKNNQVEPILTRSYYVKLDAVERDEAPERLEFLIQLCGPFEVVGGDGVWHPPCLEGGLHALVLLHEHLTQQTSLRARSGWPPALPSDLAAITTATFEPILR